MGGKKKREYRIEKGSVLTMGATAVHDGIHFTVALLNEEECRLNLYDKISGNLAQSILLTEEYKTGSVFSVFLKNVSPDQYTYLYQSKDQEFLDPYAKLVYGRGIYGKWLSKEEKKKIRCGLLCSDFQWNEEQKLLIPYSELLIYKLHVRGFTKHDSSQVLHKGTYLGLIEKIPYLKELGINCIQLMPAYEYNEIIECLGAQSRYKINYWGYSGENSYFAPKSSYASNPDNAIFEFKTMVQALHKNGIEIIMEMNFTKDTNQNLIQDCLRYWSMEYHIDGFKLSCDVVPSFLLATDPLLSNVKLLSEGWNTDQIYGKDFKPGFKNLAEYNTGFSVDVKRFLKSEEEKVGPFSTRFRRNPDKCGVINYITNHDGFTLADLYSYDVKHNDANGENNYDGEEYNYSWNCGEEGITKKKKIVDIRKKQIKNAFTALLLSQGTPLILSGDEFCNSQSGNNNAYCQDNEIGWLNWELLKTNREIMQFVKQLITIRTEHPILHREDQLRNMDYIACGMPDISYHGTKAWYPDYSHYSRWLGILLCGNYAKVNRKEQDWTFYIGFNMYWEKREYDLPMLPLGKQWYELLDTSIKDNKLGMNLLNNQKQYEISPRTIIVLVGK